jgi:hypothetical protein
MVFLSCERGAIDDRCYAMTGVGILLLGEMGVRPGACLTSWGMSVEGGERRG